MCMPIWRGSSPIRCTSLLAAGRRHGRHRPAGGLEQRGGICVPLDIEEPVWDLVAGKEVLHLVSGRRPDAAEHADAVKRCGLLAFQSSSISSRTG